ncbi:MAG: hypothetical protein P8X82_14700, partial [Gemmatimonadales bacterium]
LGRFDQSIKSCTGVGTALGIGESSQPRGISPLSCPQNPQGGATSESSAEPSGYPFESEIGDLQTRGTKMAQRDENRSIDDAVELLKENGFE